MQNSDIPQIEMVLYFITKCKEVGERRVQMTSYFLVSPCFSVIWKFVLITYLPDCFDQLFTSYSQTVEHLSVHHPQNL